MSGPHQHGGTDAPECTTCRSQRPVTGLVEVLLRHRWAIYTCRCGWRPLTDRQGSWLGQEDQFQAHAEHVAAEQIAHLRAVAADEGVREDRWVPIAESGDRWAPRATQEAAEQAMRDYPAGGRYTDGVPWDGVARIVHEARWVTEWTEADHLDARPSDPEAAR